jgi:lipopolysaccharide biosynthesis glycosyltransferase
VLFLKNWDQITNLTAVIKTQNLSVGARKHWGQISSNFNRAIIESNNRYFNAGVLILNASSWGHEQLDLKCENAIRDYTKLLFEFADQCVLNYVLKGKYLEINRDFNAIPEELRVRRTKLLHFAGSIKPWSLKINTLTRIISPIECISFSNIPIMQWRAFIMYRKLELEVVNFISIKQLLDE